MRHTPNMRWATGAVVLALVIVFGHDPLGTQYPRMTNVPEGATLSETARAFEAEGVVTSSFFLRGLVTLMGGGDDVKAGDYLFEEGQGTLTIAWRLMRGDFRIVPVRVLIPEGTSVVEMADILAEAIPSFDGDAFVALASHREGYLFPDTYLFQPNTSPERVIESMATTFNEKVAVIATSVEMFGKPLRDVVIMASILEEEADTTEDRRIIAGILWKRMDIGMALQVDAPFAYLLGKASHELTLDDLETDSPYNTYTNRGLPPTPITNPGLDAIRAAVTPIATDYLFYLHDSDGVTRYAVDFDEHVANKERYLWSR